MRHSGLTKKIATALLSLIIAAGAAAAAAASTPRAGDQAGAAPLKVEGLASTATPLYPGANGDVTIEVRNPNPHPVTVTSVSLEGTNADIAADASHPGCTTTGVSFNRKAHLSIVVPARSGDADGSARATLEGAVAMSNASVNGCQGAEFSIPVSVTGAGG